MDWFRSWHGAPTDTKWLLIARKANVAPGMVSAVAWALFDYASQHAERGSVAGFDVETYAAFSGFEEDDIANVLAAMRAKRIIDTDDKLANWDKRQPKREDDSTPRVKAFRQRDSERVTQCNAVEHTVTQGNAPEQIQIRTDAEQNRAEQSAAPSAAPAPPVAPAAPKRKAATALPTPDAARVAAVHAYETSVGLIAGAQQAEEIHAMLDDLDERGASAWWPMALKVAEDRNARNWSFVRGVLNKCLAQNTPPGVWPNGAKNGKGAPADPLQAYSVDDLPAHLRAVVKS